MSIRQQAQRKTRTGNRASIWLALAVALGLHSLFLLLPLGRNIPVTQNVPAQLEVQLSILKAPAPAPKVPDLQPEIQPPVAMAEAETEMAIIIPETAPVQRPPKPATPVQIIEPETTGEAEKSELASVILSRQYITEQSVTDRIFGKSPVTQSSSIRKDFHFPDRQNLLTMLYQPLPELPFAYTPELVHFAYDPGIKGDLQRFWDVITPEFGWRTNNGTEFKCVWVLVIAACGWK